MKKTNAKTVIVWLFDGMCDSVLAYILESRIYTAFYSLSLLSFTVLNSTLGLFYIYVAISILLFPRRFVVNSFICWHFLFSCNVFPVILFAALFQKTKCEFVCDSMFVVLFDCIKFMGKHIQYTQLQRHVEPATKNIFGKREEIQHHIV